MQRAGSDGVDSDLQPLRLEAGSKGAMGSASLAIEGEGDEGQEEEQPPDFCAATAATGTPAGLEVMSPAPVPGLEVMSPAPVPAAVAATKARTTILINLASIMERVDEQLLPALYRYVGASFQATPKQLGVLTFSRAVVQALASPLAGLLGHRFDRVAVISAGAALWGTCCMGFATTNSISQAIPLWATNGIGLALLIPAAQSLTADLNPAEHRGRAFGLLHLTGAVGALLGTLAGTNLGHMHPAGIQGWRVAFALVALFSWLLGAATFCFARDPREEHRRSGKAVATHKVQSWREALSEMRDVVRVPSFLIIILQGIVGTTPWLALVFITLWLQLLGFSDFQASLLVAAFLAANAAGGLLGGLLGDWASRRWPDHGRIAVCQLSVSVGVPLSALLFKGLPQQASSASTALYTLVLVITGLTITWAGTACNNPIFAEIVQPEQRNLCYAFDRGFEGAVAACAAPLVGWLAETAFNFTGTAEVGADAAQNRERAHALGSALLVFTALPWTLCALFFTGLHFTYPRDRARAAAAAEVAAAEAAEAAAALEEDTGVELVAMSPLSEEEFTEQDKRALLGSGSSGRMEDSATRLPG